MREMRNWILFGMNLKFSFTLMVKLTAFVSAELSFAVDLRETNVFPLMFLVLLGTRLFPKVIRAWEI